MSEWSQLKSKHDTDFQYNATSTKTTKNFVYKSIISLNKLNEEDCVPVLLRFSSQNILLAAAIVNKRFSKSGKKIMSKHMDIRLDRKFLKWKNNARPRDKQLVKTFAFEFQKKSQ